MQSVSTLVVEDDEDLAWLLQSTMEAAGYRVMVVSDGHEAVREAVRLRPDLVLLDSGIPSLSGPEVCRALRADFRTAAAVIVFVTGHNQTADVVAAFDAGADDYVVKPFEPEHLVARTYGALRRSSELRGLSPLTGLPGNFVILREIDRLVSSRQPFALIYGDLDHFKAFNDRYGFLRGDAAIRTNAQLLATSLETLESPPRFLGHVGGDDFVLLVAAHEAESVAESVVDAFDTIAPTLYDDADASRGSIEVPTRDGAPREYPLLTISLGIATSRSRVFDSAHHAVAIATEVESLAKQSKGSCWRIDRRTAQQAR